MPSWYITSVSDNILASAVIMAENSRTACFPHCVSSCFGIRKRRSNDPRHSKLKENEKAYQNITGKPAVDSSADGCRNGSKLHQKVNGKVSCSNSCGTKEEINWPPDPVLIQPEKSALPLLDEFLNDAADSNGHVMRENVQVLSRTKGACSECNNLDSVLNEAPVVASSCSNRTTIDVNIAEQSHRAEEKSDISKQKSVDNEIVDTSSPRCGEGKFSQSLTSQSVQNHSDEIGKENIGVTMSEEMKNVHNDEGSKYHAHFRELLETEKNKLTTLVLEWSELLSTDIKVEVQDEIRSVTGQTNLIITERFTQFNRLICQSEGTCEDNKSDGKVILASDLQGFWDMIIFQVKDVLNKFERLETLRKSNWDLKKLNSDVPSTKIPKKKVTTKNAVSADSDKEKARRLAARKRIAEARQRLKEHNQQTSEHGVMIL